MLDRRDNIEPYHPNTCQWILELEEYQSWMSQSRGLLWIKGKPGTGKSTLMRSLHERRERLQDQSEMIWLDFFFTARGEELQRTPLGMLRSLLNQIFEFDPTIRPQVCEIYKARSKRFGGDGDKWEWPQRVLEDLLVEVILLSASQKQITVFVDALDESGAESAQQMAAYFHRLVDNAEERDVSVRVCISCRHYPIMEITGAKEIYVEDHNHDDISRYIRDLLAGIDIGDSTNDHLLDTLVEQMIHQANDLFQWARLVIPLVKRQAHEGESLQSIRRWLQQVPNGLENLYKYVLEHVIEDRNRAQSCLFFQWLCLAERPLTVTEMRYAIVAKDAGMKAPVKSWSQFSGFIENDERMKQKIKALSGGLAEVVTGNDNALVQTVHQSAQDFLRSKGLELLCRNVNGDQFLLNDEPVLHQCQVTLYRSCLGYLATMHISRKWAECLAEGPNISPHLDAVQRMNPDTRDQFKNDFPFIEYAIVNLFTHARKSVGTATSSGADALKRDYDVLKQFFGRWMRIYTRLLTMPRVVDYPRDDTTLLHAAAAANLTVVIELLLQDGQNIEITDKEGYTALHSAAQQGHIAAAKSLLENGAEPNAQSSCRHTPLTDAAACGNLKLVELILAHGASIDTTRADSNPLHEAVRKGEKDVVEILLEAGADINAESGEFGVALQVATAANKDSEIVQLLIDAGADVNKQGGKYGHALQAAAVSGQSPEMVQMLLDAGADVNAEGGKYGSALQAAATGGDGLTPLYVASITRERIKIVQMLLDAGANVDAQGGEYHGVVTAAAKAGSAELMQILLDAGAKVIPPNGKASLALQTAASNKGPEVVQMLLAIGGDVHAEGYEVDYALLTAAESGESPEIVRMLLDAGANVNTRGGPHGYPLQAAASGGPSFAAQTLLEFAPTVDISLNDDFVEMVSWAIDLRAHSTEIMLMLLDAGADVNLQGGERGYALHVAAAARDTRSRERVQILLSAGADVNAQGGRFGCALQAAAFGNIPEIVQAILSSGADVNAQGGDYGNALNAAIFRGNTEIMQLLLDAGADTNVQGGYYGYALQAAVCEDDRKILQMLLDAGANVNIEGGLYGSPLLAAVDRRRIDYVEKLVHAGADVSLVNQIDQTPLHIAASNDLVEFLNRVPAHVSVMNRRDKLARTPLHLAVCHGHIQFVMKLLLTGADPALSDGYGKNVLDWAVGNDELVHQIQANCPGIAITLPDDQRLATFQSILQVSETLLSSNITTPGPLLQQLGHYLLSLNDLDKARHIFNLRRSCGRLTHHTDGYRDLCGMCKVPFPTYVCRVCADMQICYSCAQKYPNHSRLHPTQKHEMIQVSNSEPSHEKSEPEQLRKFLSNLVQEFSAPSAEKLKVVLLDDSTSHSALQQQTDPTPGNSLDLTSVSYAFLFALIVAFFSFYFL
ncbi:unnamed protein product [Penicillium salamii]|nr:unnamed protein product [Penicillium salamii]